MLATKIIETKITFKNLVDIYNPDIKRVCIQNLTARYKGKCYHSALILAIKRIIRLSNPIVTDDMDASFNISVEFEAECINFLAGELIVGSKIVRIEEDKIYAENQYAKIQIDQGYATSFFKTGEVYPLIVLYARYGILKPKISLICMPFIPITRTHQKLWQDRRQIMFAASMLASDGIIYEVQKDVADDIKTIDQEIAEVQTRITELQTRIKTIITKSASSFNFFRGLMNTAKQEKQGRQATHDKNIISIEKPLSHGKYIRPDGLAPDSAYIQRVENENNNTGDEENQTRISGSPKKIQLILLNKYLHNLNALDTLTKEYPTTEAINKSMPVWSMYRNLAKQNSPSA